MNYLLLYDWPGNVAELERTVESAVSCGSDPVSRDLRDALASQQPDPVPLLGMTEFTVERETIVRALEKVAGNTSEAAVLLGISPGMLRRRLDFYNL